MTPEERERIYDEEIAPALLKLCERCDEVGMSFLALAEWAPDDIGRTSKFQPGHGFKMDWAMAGARANGNADVLIGYLINQATSRGHGSVYLLQLGVPTRPVDAPAPVEHTGNDATPIDIAGNRPGRA